MKKLFKSVISCAVVVLSAVLPLSMTGCGKNGPNSFTVWLSSKEPDTFYMDYSENPIVNYLADKEWAGATLNFEYSYAPTGTEKDNFNTLIGGGDFDDIMSLDYCNDSILKLYDEGVAMDITDYVKDYMPTYYNLVTSDPELYREAVTIVDGEPRFLYLLSINDAGRDMYQGIMYRRDWLVRFGEMPEYVWATDADALMELDHSERQAAAPEITNYFKAKQTYGNNESEWLAHGWKKNSLYQASGTDSFVVGVGGTRGNGIISSWGDDPMNDYTDNLVFPSGIKDPVFLSDWEWMFETFETKVWNNSSYKDKDGAMITKNNAYMMSVYCYGANGQGDFSSSFGGGSSSIYLDSKTGKIMSGITEERSRLYLQYMNGWYQSGWLDNDFSSRTQDLFYQIDTTNMFAGRIGAFIGQRSTQIGNYIEDESLPLTRGIMVVGARIPMNDVIGDSAYRFVEPDTIYQETRYTSKTMITTAAEGKNLEALFAYFDYSYTQEGAELYSLGLSKTQYDETQDSFYKKWNLTNGAYVKYDTPVNGKTYKWADNNPEMRDLNSAARANRLPWGYHYVGILDHGYDAVDQWSVDNWNFYPNKGHCLTNLMAKAEVNDAYTQAFTGMMETMNTKMPGVIKAPKGTFDILWNNFKNDISANAIAFSAELQKVLDKYNNLSK